MLVDSLRRIQMKHMELKTTTHFLNKIKRLSSIVLEYKRLKSILSTQKPFMLSTVNELHAVAFISSDVFNKPLKDIVVGLHKIISSKHYSDKLCVLSYVTNVIDDNIKKLHQVIALYKHEYSKKKLMSAMPCRHGDFWENVWIFCKQN